jgi:hypothetical protein
MLQREKKQTEGNRYSIGRLLSPRDEAIDLNGQEWEAALVETRHAWHADAGRLQETGSGVPSEPNTPNGPAIRKIRGFGTTDLGAHPERGLLLLYVLDPEKANADFPPETPGVVAFGMSFPGSRSGLKVEYKVNNVLWEQEYGSAE